MKRYCLKCKNSFEPVRKNHVFCSSKCRTDSWKINHHWKDEDFSDNTNNASLQNKIPYIKVEQGLFFETIQKAKLAEQFWIYSHSMLWPTQDFNEEQQIIFKKHLSDFFIDSNDADATFRELVERVVLAKRYVLEKPYRYVAPPQDYLNPKFYNGLESTAKWYHALQLRRRTDPNCGESLEIFSEAVLNYASKRNILDIVFYRQLFISLEAPDLLQWYLNAIIHYQFINY